MYRCVFYTFFIFALVIWSAIAAVNFTTKLEKINQFTSGRPENLTATLNTTSSISNLSVPGVFSSCAGHCSSEIQQSVLKGKRNKADRFQAFHKVCNKLYSMTLFSGH